MLNDQLPEFRERRESERPYYTEPNDGFAIMACSIIIGIAIGYGWAMI